ncbi:MAG: hypothetical protein AAGD10_13115 [Myxococcota bacterium]
MRPIWISALLAVLGACTEVETPEAALDAFLEDARRGRWEQASRRVSKETMAWLRARHGALVGEEDAATAKAEALFDSLGLRVEQVPRSIVVVSPIGARVTLRATVEEGRSAEFPMVEEGGGWRVDLSRALQPAGGVRGSERAVSK